MSKVIEGQRPPWLAEPRSEAAGRKPHRLRSLRLFDQSTAASILHHATVAVQSDLVKSGHVSANQIRDAVDRQIEAFVSLQIRIELSKNS